MWFEVGEMLSDVVRSGGNGERECDMETHSSHSVCIFISA